MFIGRRGLEGPPTKAILLWLCAYICEDAKCKKAQRDNGQCLPDYVASPNHAYQKKHWGPRLSILCLLGDQWGGGGHGGKVKTLKLVVADAKWG